MVWKIVGIIDLIIKRQTDHLQSRLNLRIIIKKAKEIIRGNNCQHLLAYICANELPEITDGLSSVLAPSKLAR